MAWLALAVLLLAIGVWAGRRVGERVRAARSRGRRVRLEDALKHVHNCEYGGRRASVESLAGALGVPLEAAVRVAGELSAEGLARMAADGVELTEEGRTYALRVVRSHRLWERYLADRTGVAPADWHRHAELREHTLSEAEARRLATTLGNPLYDPHGDPIPTAAGEMPPQAGEPLTTLEAGDAGSIVHVEDEPREVYDRLVRAGLAPRTELEVLPSEPGEVRFRAGGREHALDPVVAAGISVERLEADAVRDPGLETLAAVRPGETARVVRIAPICQGPQRRRLLDLGVVPGTEIRAELRSAAGDPVAYDIRGALIALRREQAEWILVRRDGTDEAASGAGKAAAADARSPGGASAGAGVGA